MTTSPFEKSSSTPHAGPDLVIQHDWDIRLSVSPETLAGFSDRFQAALDQVEAKFDDYSTPNSLRSYFEKSRR